MCSFQFTAVLGVKPTSTGDGGGMLVPNINASAGGFDSACNRLPAWIIGLGIKVPGGGSISHSRLLSVLGEGEENRMRPCWPKNGEVHPILRYPVKHEIIKKPVCKNNFLCYTKNLSS